MEPDQGRFVPDGRSDARPKAMADEVERDLAGRFRVPGQTRRYARISVGLKQSMHSSVVSIARRDTLQRNAREEQFDETHVAR